MSSRASRLLEPLRDRLGGGSEEYECRLCSLRFDRERLNCPACGCSEMRKAS